MLTKPQVQHIANLARIKLTPNDLERYSKELSAILDYVNQLDKIDTVNVQPLSQVAGLKNVYQEDCSQKEQFLSQAQVLDNAPEKESGFFRVKSVF